MIYSVDFQELCRNISHIDLAKYVTDLNWVAYKGKTANFLKIFQKEYNDNFYQIIIPFNRNLSDYTEAMYKAISVVAITEEKSTEQVILELLNPLNILSRGYSITYFNDKALKSIKKINKEDILNIRLKDGFIETKVLNIKEEK